MSPASAAVDGDLRTASCTDAKMVYPWWAVDLGGKYDIGRVVVTCPVSGVDDRNYPSILFHQLMRYISRESWSTQSVCRSHASVYVSICLSVGTIKAKFHCAS